MLNPNDLTLLRALAQVRASIPPLEADALNDECGNRYISLDQILRVCNPLLTAAGLLALPDYTYNLEVRLLTVRITVVHIDTGATKPFELPFPVLTGTPHEIGGISSYGIRYLMRAVLGLSAEDSDGNLQPRSSSQVAPATWTHPETHESSIGNIGGRDHAEAITVVPLDEFQVAWIQPAPSYRSQAPASVAVAPRSESASMFTLISQVRRQLGEEVLAGILQSSSGQRVVANIPVGMRGKVAGALQCALNNAARKA